MAANFQGALTPSELSCLTVDEPVVPDPDDTPEWPSMVWIPDETGGFVGAAIKEERGDEVECVVYETGRKMNVLKEDIQKMNPPRFNKAKDMADFTFLNEASVLHNLKSRYFSDLIYVSTLL